MNRNTSKKLLLRTTVVKALSSAHLMRAGGGGRNDTRTTNSNLITGCPGDDDTGSGVLCATDDCPAPTERDCSYQIGACA